MNMNKRKFEEININDEFFYSLKNDYPGFENWYRGKKGEKAYVQYDDNQKIQGFLYLKIENNVVDDIRPKLVANKILKVGTFKINAHGTRLGERFIKKILDEAVKEGVDFCYITIFPKHTGLIKLIQQFGFVEYGQKGDVTNFEKVFIRDMKKSLGNINYDYPFIKTSGVNKYILGIYPRYHSVMFTDSILKTENKGIIQDISYGNSIHKIYVCRLDVEKLNRGDIIVIYRTSEENKYAEYSSVVTSVCVVEETKKQEDFRSFNEFFEYASQYSVFDRDDLLKWYKKGMCKTIKFTYNIALESRITRHDLIETIGLSRKEYWGFFKITDQQFQGIVELGKVNRNILR